MGGNRDRNRERQLRLTGLIAALAVLFTIASASYAQDRDAVLVDREWLADQFDGDGCLAPDVVVLQINTNDDGAYEAAHIPGAVKVLRSDVQTVRGGISGQLAPLDDLIALVRRAGIDHDTWRVVIMSGNKLTNGEPRAADSASNATRLYWILNYLGLGDKTRVLDGHMWGWYKEYNPDGPTTNPNRPVCDSSSCSCIAPAPSDYTPPGSPHQDEVIGMREVSDLLSTQALARVHHGPSLDPRNAPFGFLYLDTRGAGSYAGDGGAGGHLPGAISTPWNSPYKGSDRLTDSSDTRPAWDKYDKHTYEFSDTSDLVDLVRNQWRVRDGLLVIQACATGRSATLNFLIFKIVGVSGRLLIYDGSFQEYGFTPIDDDLTQERWMEVIDGLKLKPDHPAYMRVDEGMMPLLFGNKPYDKRLP